MSSGDKYSTFDDACTMHILDMNWVIEAETLRAKHLAEVEEYRNDVLPCQSMQFVVLLSSISIRIAQASGYSRLQKHRKPIKQRETLDLAVPCSAMSSVFSWDATSPESFLPGVGEDIDSDVGGSGGQRWHEISNEIDYHMTIFDVNWRWIDAIYIYIYLYAILRTSENNLTLYRHSTLHYSRVPCRTVRCMTFYSKNTLSQNVTKLFLTHSTFGLFLAPNFLQWGESGWFDLGNGILWRHIVVGLLHTILFDPSPIPSETEQQTKLNHVGVGSRLEVCSGPKNWCPSSISCTQVCKPQKIKRSIETNIFFGCVIMFLEVLSVLVIRLYDAVCGFRCQICWVIINSIYIYIVRFITCPIKVAFLPPQLPGCSKLAHGELISVAWGQRESCHSKSNHGSWPVELHSDLQYYSTFQYSMILV